MKIFIFAVLVIGIASASADAQGVIMHQPNYGPMPYVSMPASSTAYAQPYHAQRPTENMRYQSYQYPTQPPVYQGTQMAQPPAASNGFFGELMELERRKNAWLRQTFFSY